MTLFLRLSALTALAFTLTACETVLDADPTSQITPGASVHAVNHAIYGTPDALKEGRTVDELNTLIRRNFEPLDEIVPGTDTAYMWFFRSERPLAEKDRAAAELLAAHEGIEWLHLRQMVATQLLDLHARNGSDDLDAIERYTAILIEAENPSADLVAWALPQLDERWTAAQRRDAAGVAVEAATEWLARSCADCTETARRATAPVADASTDADGKRRAVSDAVGTLAGLAQG